jgi:D-alanyl-D-alanine endopeptidase (penicillin-binding protein 7)
VSIGQAIGLHQVGDPLELRSSVAMVLDQQTGQTLYQKNADAVLPIASITKVMTAMVVLDAALDPSEVIAVVEADRDTERFSSITRRWLRASARTACMSRACGPQTTRGTCFTWRGAPPRSPWSSGYCLRMR